MSNKNLNRKIIAKKENPGKSRSNSLPINKLKRYFQKNNEISAAYLFGSSVLSPDSARDLDIAILLGQGQSANNLIKVQTKFLLDFKNLIGRPDIDLIILNNAPLLLRHEVIKSGQLIYEKDEDARIDFEVVSDLKYYDFEPTRQSFSETLKSDILKGRFYAAE